MGSLAVPDGRRRDSVWGAAWARAERLIGQGWSVQRHDRSDVARSYGRPTPGAAAGGFITATRSARHPRHHVLSVRSRLP